MGSANKAFNGMMWSLLVNIISAIYGFIATPLLIKYFGRSEYGLIALATSINGYMALMDLGLTNTNVRFFSNWLSNGDEVKVKKLMQTCTAFYTCVGIINAIVLAIVSIFSGYIFDVSPEQDIVLKRMLYVLCITAIVNWSTSCYNQLISATENVAWVQKRTLFGKFLMMIVVILTLVFKLTIFEYFVGVMCCGFLILPITIRKVKKEAPFISFLPKFDKKVFREILPYSLGIFSFGFFQFTYNQSKVIILGMQGTVSSITDYGVMVAIASLVSMVGSVFIQSLLPASSRIVAKGDKENFDRVAYRGTHFITMILCFCAFGLMTVDKDLVMVYVGKEFMHIIPWLNIWLILTITGNVSGISSLILAGTDVKPLAYSSAAASMAAIIFSWFSVPQYEAGGIVIGMIVYNAIQQIFYYCYYWKKVLKIDTWRIFIKTDVPFLLMGGSIMLALSYVPHFDNHWVNIFVFGLVFAIIYIIVTYIFLDDNDTEYIIKLIKKK